MTYAQQSVLTSGAQAPGLVYATPNVAITQAQITAWQAAGYSGVYLDPRYEWTLPSVMSGISNFIVESRMTGSIGWLGNIIAPTTGYIQTGSANTDGLIIYGNPTTTYCQGLVFRYCSFIGANPNGVVHNAGGTRGLELDHCFIQNTATSAGSYAFIMDTAQTENTEDCTATKCYFAGGYGGLGIGNGPEAAGSPNDSLWTDITTAGGTYGIMVNDGSGHTFTNWYDRSGATGGSLYITSNVASSSHFWLFGGETHNTTGPNYNHQGGILHLWRADTTGAITLGGGKIILHAGQTGGVTVTCTGGAYDVDPVANGSQLTFTGSGSNVTYWVLNPFGAPTFSSYTGTISAYGNYPQQVAQSAANGATGTTTLTYTPRTVAGSYRAVFYVRATAVGTSVTQGLSYTNIGGTTSNVVPPMMKSGSATPVLSIVGTGLYSAVWPFNTDNSGGTITLTLTVVGTDTFEYELLLIRDN